WLAIYLPDTGRGFIKDDYAWLLAAPLSSAPLSAAFTASTGFFRPLVSLSFTADYVLFGLDPLGYGLTNMALALGCAAMIYLLARALGAGVTGAAAASAVWLFTPHGMDMAIIWISGRAALIVIFFGVASCWMAARGRLAVSALLLGAALLGKDEAVVVPLLAAICIALSGRRLSRSALAAWAGGCLAAVAVYLWMRAASGALTPSSAPVEYRPLTDIAGLAANAAQYADRLITFPLIIVALAWLVMRGGRTPAPWRLVAGGLAWAAIAMAPTLAIPVRSSLYVLLPLAGVAIAAGAVIEALVERASLAARWRAAAAAIVIVTVAIPLYRSRQDEWSGAARLSEDVTRVATPVLKNAPDGSRVFARDEPGKVSLESTFGNLLPEMLRVTSGKTLPLATSREQADYELAISHGGSRISVSLAPVPR
nr:hypothetical protein [Acidobacteriota bacterium]